MPNSITLPVQYQQAADLIYKAAALTSVFDNGQIQIVGKEIKIKKISVDGPADISRGGAFVGGDATASWQTKTPNYDRARKFSIDALDEAEFGGLYMDVLAEYIRTKLVPELDADRFATYASAASILAATPATLADAAALLVAINTAMGDMDTNEVPVEGRVLACESSQLRAIQALDTTKSRETLASFGRILSVPKTRFYSKISKYDGTTTGQTAGGYVRYGSQYDAWEAAHAYSLNDMIEANGKVYKCTTAGTSGSAAPTWPSTGTVSDGAGALVWTFQAISGREINFLIAHPTAILQGLKRTVSPVDMPDADYDSWRVAHRCYGIHEVYDNKVKGIYLHRKA